MTAHHKKQGATGYPRDERNGCSSAKARRPVVEADPMRARADGHRAEQAVGDEDLGITPIHGRRPPRPGLVEQHRIAPRDRSAIDLHLLWTRRAHPAGR